MYQSNDNSVGSYDYEISFAMLKKFILLPTIVANMKTPIR